jgi:hypothetical protein
MPSSSGRVGWAYAFCRAHAFRAGAGAVMFGMLCCGVGFGVAQHASLAGRLAAPPPRRVRQLAWRPTGSDRGASPAGALP